ncbi:efflux RND transporter periplasmic adaptor subunit [Tepidibacillus marianensis]|uniref:efflux RND transporter periplasmic adaptor subunit n=1 Tax=Tepidibacillus marianensis TaxID=3131995 RepID=UPI0030D3CF92
MHRSSLPRGIAIILIFILFIAGCSTKNVQEDKNQPIPVQVTKVERKTIENQDRYIGTIKAKQDIMVYSKITGKIQQVNVKVGDQVKAGQALLKVDATDVSYSLRQANTQYQAALDNLNRAKDAKNQAEAQLQQAEKAANPLNPETAKAVEVAKSTVQQTEANVAAAQAQVNQAKVAVDQASNTVSEANVKAPIAGTVSSVMTEKGEMAAPQSPVIQIINSDTLIVQLNSVTESSIQKFAIGQKVQVSLPNAKSTVEGTVTSVSLAANSQTLTYPVEIQIVNKDKTIRPGMLAEILTTQSTENQLVIPTKAIIGTGEEAHVFVIANNKAVKKPIKMRDMSTGNTVIEGLSEKDQIVIKGQYMLTNGSPVKITTEAGKTL